MTTILAPFFAIIRSSLSTGPITSAALSALHSFFDYGLINPDSPALESALGELSNVVANCKFEASDSSGDEAVLLKIMTVIQDCMCGSVSNKLGDVEVCEMLETVLTTCCQMRLSGMLSTVYTSTKILRFLVVEILRRSAELTIHNIVRRLYLRLRVLDPAIEEEKLQRVKMSVTTDAAPLADRTSDTHSDDPTDSTAVATGPDAAGVLPSNSPQCKLSATFVSFAHSFPLQSVYLRSWSS